MEIRTEVFVPRAGSRDGDLVDLEWRETDPPQRIREYVYSERDLAGALSVRGPQMAAVLDELHPGPMFRLMAQCLTTGRAVGEWTWEHTERRFLPAERPWFVWDDRLRLEALAAREAEAGAGAGDCSDAA